MTFLQSHIEQGADLGLLTVILLSCLPPVIRQWALFCYRKLLLIAKGCLSHSDSHSPLLLMSPALVDLGYRLSSTSLSIQTSGEGLESLPTGPVTLTLRFPNGRQEAHCSGTQRTFCPDRTISAFSSIFLTFSKNYGEKMATMHRKKLWWGAVIEGCKFSLSFGH